MKHWLDKAIELVNADIVDLRKLAELAGSDPKFFYFGTHLDDVNLCGQDLRGMHFTGLDVTPVFFDSLTRLDARYMRKLKNNPKAVRVMNYRILGAVPSEELKRQARKRIEEILAHSKAGQRAGKVLAAVLEERDVGLLILENYPIENTITEDRAVLLMRQKLERDNADDLSTLQLFVALTVEELLKRAYIYNRTTLLIALVHELKSFPIVQQLLASKVKQSRSMLIEKEKPELLKLLRTPSI